VGKVWRSRENPGKIQGKVGKLPGKSRETLKIDGNNSENRKSRANP
jgi:hypothetical protein